jgi:gliding motility-associated lipoprotein GldH
MGVSIGQREGETLRWDNQILRTRHPAQKESIKHQNNFKMKILKLSFSLFLVFTMSIFCISCDRSSTPVYEKYLKMKNTTWDRFDIKQFEIPVEEAAQNYDITAVVRCSEQFQYDNLPFYVILTTPSGEERMREVTIPVRENGKITNDPKTMKPESRLVLWSSINIADKGQCKITLENMIPKFQTEGIDEIGIVVTKAAK